ncbi:N-formylglutamate amidohydrolase [Abyssalbus ytuae]|uniref:N-formylglutamate amidohydrolase n=1 Tax=Abyssalbus ytuae TaxID=2926907 RepID=A0A9E6ZNS3_9FLAO|nr:N-formylglutamate amidohydrolase [Abyssalbus ytuae]UOB17750.1 N-formylglutamate amidohydrolase [Abyssalbus ytuae]
MDLFKITVPKKDIVPIIISIPHAGTHFPSGIRKNYRKRLRKYLDDTDWFVDKLYDFAPEMGITVIKANLSRWVIDLNRDSENIPLYNDNRLITSITPVTDFLGNEIYKSKKLIPNAKEVKKRIKKYYNPYHKKLQDLINDRKQQFGKVLLWDAHSIRHKVSTIQHDVFPDMILGDNDQKTAHTKLIETALAGLKTGDFKVSHNSPFKGGQITRSLGNPKENIHTLQLEMNKILYMDDNELHYNKERAGKVKKVLKTTLENLIETLKEI